MKMKNIYALLLTTLVSVSSGSAFAQSGDFVGTWVNVDSHTRGITKMVIKNTGKADKKVIKTWGKCHPTDCYWGAKHLFLAGKSVSDTDYQFGMAGYRTSFSITTINLEYKDDGRLMQDTFTRFIDGSNRKSYHSYNIYKKQ